MPTHDSFLPHEKHVLENGLEVVLHEDHSSPVVAVFVYYHVGSSREEAGKSGFAHLFEHMLFQGSEHVGDNDHFRLIQEAGGTLNGTTNQDRTNYFEVLPANQLELALWLESDRMGFLLPAMTQEKLDNQRDVVMNERRQSYENRPYGLVPETVLEALYPPGHPYAWPTIGSMADIAAATLEDVARFFRRWYGPNNATLAIGGDVDPAEALDLVRRYFGPLPRGPEVERPRPEPARLASTRRAVLEDAVRLPQLTLVWPTVELGHAHEVHFDLLADVLSANRSSILDRALMVEEELASSVAISHRAGERAGMLQIDLRPASGVSLEELERRVLELIEDYAREGVPAARLEELKVRREGAIVRSLETVGARTSRLGFDNLFFGTPDRVREEIDRVRAVSEPELRAIAREALAGAPHVAVSVVPTGRLDLAAAGRTPEQALEEAALDRSRQPTPASPPAFHSPEVWRAELPNGVRLGGTPVTTLPLTRLSLAVPAGRLAQGPATLGLAELTARMLEEGTRELTGVELQSALDGIGGTLAIGVTDEELTIQMSVLDEHRARAADLLTDLVVAPRLDPEDFERVRRQLLVDLEARRDRAASLARDGFARLVHGDGVAGAPALGTQETIAALEVSDLRAFWSARARPEAARLVLAGDLDAAEAGRVFARLGSEWVPGAAVEPVTLDAPDDARFPPRVVIHLVDRPGAQQSELRVGHGGISRLDPDWFCAQAMNHVVGGSFTSRINLNLREEKGYTYGARSGFSGGRLPGPFVVSTAVQTDVTAPALGEILKELSGLAQGFTDEEVEFARASLSQSLTRSFESGAARLAVVDAVLRYGWPADFPERRLAWLETMRTADLDAVARKLVRPEHLHVLVVGDAERVRPGLAELAAELSVEGPVLLPGGASAPEPGRAAARAR